VEELVKIPVKKLKALLDRRGGKRAPVVTKVLKAARSRVAEEPEAPAPVVEEEPEVRSNVAARVLRSKRRRG
jgi:hypothetical protein